MEDRGRFAPFGQRPYWEHAHNGHPFLHLIVLALIVFLLVAAGIWLYRRLLGHAAPAQLAPATAGGPNGPLEIVQMRYARGEIGRDEYKQLTADLGGAAEAERGSEETSA